MKVAYNDVLPFYVFVDLLKNERLNEMQYSALYAYTLACWYAARTLYSQNFPGAESVGKRAESALGALGAIAERYRTKRKMSATPAQQAAIAATCTAWDSYTQCIPARTMVAAFEHARNEILKNVKG